MKLIKLLTAAALMAAAGTSAVADVTSLGKVTEDGSAILTPACQKHVNECRSAIFDGPAGIYSLSALFGSEVAAKRVISGSQIKNVSPETEVEFNGKRITFYYQI